MGDAARRPPLVQSHHGPDVQRADQRERRTAGADGGESGSDSIVNGGRVTVRNRA